MFSLIVDGREEKIAAAKREPSQIMQEVIQIAAVTPSSEYVILFCAWMNCFLALCITKCSPFCFFRPEDSLKEDDTLNEDQKHASSTL